MSNNIENFNTFTETIIKQIVSKDDEETRKMIIKYAKEKYPNENVRIDFCDEEKVKRVIELGIAEYIKKENDLYKARILGEFNTVSNNIEEDIKIVEEKLKEWKENPQIMIQPENFKVVKSLENVLNNCKNNQEIIKEVKKYAISLQNYEEYEKKHSKLSRRIKLIQEGLTINYRISRIAYNIINLLNGEKWTRE